MTNQTVSNPVTRNFLITAGGMKQPIDGVRSITNSSKGKLGLEFAKVILDNKAVGVGTIFYVHGPDTPVPKDKRVVSVVVEGVYDLKDKIEEILQQNQIHYALHAMAVADYVPQGVYTPQQIEQNQTQGLEGSKISSEHENLFIKLQKAPKVIDVIKTTSPTTFLVGFKLLVDQDDQKLFDAGFSMLRRTRANLVLANDLQQIRLEKNHRGLLVFPEKWFDVIEGGKHSIAQRVVEVMLRRGETQYGQSVCIGEKVSPACKQELPRLKECGQKLHKGALPVVDGGTYGNMSVLSAGDTFIITGRGVDKRKLLEEDILHVAFSKEVQRQGIYRLVNYIGPKKPSIDSAIHASIYEKTLVKAMVHIHDPSIYENLPLSENNYACGTKAERDAVVDLIEPDAQEFLVAFYKHGLLAGAADLDKCNTLLKNVKQNLCLTPLLQSSAQNLEKITVEFENHLQGVKAKPNHSRFDKRTVWSVEIKGKSLGVVSYRPVFKQGQWQAEFWMYLTENNRPKGLGKRVVALLEEMSIRDNCKKLLLFSKNQCNVADYYTQKLGFEVLKQNKQQIVLQKQVVVKPTEIAPVKAEQNFEQLKVEQNFVKAV